MDSREFDRLTSKISTLDLVDLKKIGEHVQATIIQKQTESREALTNELRAKAEAAGFDLADLIGGKAVSAPGQKIAAKYRNPDDPNVTWGGRGKRPNWINNALASGKKLDDMLIDKNAQPASADETQAA